MSEKDFDNGSDCFWTWNELAFEPALLEVIAGSSCVAIYHDRLGAIDKSKILDFIRQSVLPASKVFTECQRRCIYLYYFRSVNEVAMAAIMGIHQTTISQHLRYGKKRLLKALLKSGLVPQVVR